MVSTPALTLDTIKQLHPPPLFSLTTHIRHQHSALTSTLATAQAFG